MAEKETAKDLLENLSSLLVSIEAGNKPQTASIRVRGGLGFGRFVAVLVIVVGIGVILANIALLVVTMVGLPQSTSVTLRILAATPALGGLFSGFVLLALGMICKTAVDRTDYHAQILRLTRKRMEKR